MKAKLVSVEATENNSIFLAYASQLFLYVLSVVLEEGELCHSTSPCVRRKKTDLDFYSLSTSAIKLIKIHKKTKIRQFKSLR
jgi:hypothetical protein